LAIIEPWFLAQQLFENTDFFLQISDHVLQVAIHPASDAKQQKYKRIHRHKMAMPAPVRQHPLPSPNPLIKAAGMANFKYLDTTGWSIHAWLLMDNHDQLKEGKPIKPSHGLDWIEPDASSGGHEKKTDGKCNLTIG
jgi:hypothetical protein